MQRIAVLTSGGDAPGMNAALRAVVRAADGAGVEVLGVRDGFTGLDEDRLEPLDARSVSGLLHLGGTLIGTARCPAFHTEQGRARAADVLDHHGVEGLVVVGGDGSLRGASALSEEHGVHVVGLPGTIDNDVAGTDFSLGFDTAVNTALGMIDRIRDTAASHNRLFFVEVMGRSSGSLALWCGLAGGATEVVVPEQEVDPGRVRWRIQQSFDLGKRFCLVVVAEGVDGGAYQVAEAAVGDDSLDYRVTTLGHVQRGGAPSMRDRVLASRLGDAAVRTLLAGGDRVMVGEQDGRVTRTPMLEAAAGSPELPDDLLELMDRLAR